MAAYMTPAYERMSARHAVKHFGRDHVVRNMRRELRRRDAHWYDCIRALIVLEEVTGKRPPWPKGVRVPRKPTKERCGVAPFVVIALMRHFVELSGQKVPIRAGLKELRHLIKLEVLQRAA